MGGGSERSAGARVKYYAETHREEEKAMHKMYPLQECRNKTPLSNHRTGVHKER